MAGRLANGNNRSMWSCTKPLLIGCHLLLFQPLSKSVFLDWDSALSQLNKHLILSYCSMSKLPKLLLIITDLRDNYVSINYAAIVTELNPAHGHQGWPYRVTK